MLAHCESIRVEEDPKATTFSMRRDGVLIVPTCSEDSDEFEDLINGAGIHEIAHYLVSDYEALDAASRSERMLLNVFEDCFIERWAQGTWAGARADLLRMWNRLYRMREVSRPSGSEDDPLHLATLWALAECRSRALQLEEGAADAAASRRWFAELVDEATADAVAAVLAKVDTIASTWDSLHLARELLLIVRPEAQGSEEPEGEADSGDALIVHGEGNPPGASDGEAAGQPPDSGRVEIADFIVVATDGGDIAAAAVEIVVVASSLKAAGGAGQVELVSVALSDAACGAELLAAARASSIALREKLRHVLHGMGRSQEEFAQSGQVVPTRLWRLRLGQANVFERSDDDQGLSAFVYVLMDVSDSQEGEGLRLTVEAATSISLALEGIPGVSSAIAAFPAKQAAVGRVKLLGETTQRAVGRLAALTAHGSTPLAQALHVIESDLWASSASRKVVLLPTDGEPDDREAAVSAIQRLEALGINVIVLGTGPKAKPLGSRYVEVADVSDLATHLFACLRECLTSRLRRAA